MSCPKTEHLLQRYFADDLAPQTAEEFDRHLQQCAECQQEMGALVSARTQLSSWHEESVPHWDRHLELFRREHRASPEPRGREPRGWFSAWQWLPTAASFAMLCLLLVNTTVTRSEEGVAISFGSSPQAITEATDVAALLASFEAERDAELRSLIARIEDRQDSNNVQLLQAVMDQAQEANAENFERLYSYFEQQRLQDLQGMRAGYQELVDNDYETIRSLEQLAQYVSFDGNLR